MTTAIEPITDTAKRVAANLGAVKARMAAAARRAGRQPEDVALVAVTKSVGVETIAELVGAGQFCLAENRVQALAERGPALAEKLAAAGIPHTPVTWHMIGTLQRNKVRAVLGLVRMIHGVDSLRLAQEISQRAVSAGGGSGEDVAILLEVNVSGEATKHGVGVAEAPALARAVADLPGVCLRGLMTMAPPCEDPQQTRPVFARLRELADAIRSGLDPAKARVFDQLSMGMSGDFEVAIEEGATLVRIGSALFV